MDKLTAYRTLQELYIALTALLFNSVLWVIVKTQQVEDEKRAEVFSNMVLAVFFSNLLSIITTFLRKADIVQVPLLATYLQCVTYLLNAVVAYAFSIYVTHYFSKSQYSDKKMPLINRLSLLLQAVILLVFAIVVTPRVLESGKIIVPTGLLFVLVGFVMNLIHIIYCLFFFAGTKTELSDRQRKVLVTGFSLTISSIVLQGVIGSVPLFNYLGPTLGLMVFYFTVETPDYYKLSKALKELETERERADEENRSKSDFLANMSHEIRTPINAVLGMNEMILRESADENVTAYAHNVEGAGRNVLAIINDILDFSKIESGSLELHNAPYQFSSVLNDVCNMIVFRARSKDLTFDVDVEESVPDALLGDEVRVRQIMTNLLNNAVKYTQQGSVKLRVLGEYKTDEDYLLKVMVSDTGIGIREEDMENLFSKFERFDRKENRMVEGSGLGLAITANLLRMMEGEILVTSNYGEGSRFTALIPQKVVDKEPVGNFRKKLEQSLKELKTYRETFRAPKARILAVDDTRMNLNVVESLLKKTQVRIDLALSGEQALQYTKDTPYDLILMDQRMPEMDGTQALHNIRSQRGGINHKTPVICLTADAVQGAKERYLKEGFTDYLSKPIETKALEQILMHYLPPDKVVRIESDATADLVQEPVSGEGTKETIAALYENVKGLNYEEALTYLSSDALIEKSLRQFFEDAEQNASELERLLNENDFDNYTIKVHALKSSARLIGAADLSEKARRLEEMGNQLTED